MGVLADTGLAVARGVHALVRRRRGDRLAILMYHGVVERALDPFCWHQLPVAAFRRQLTWVKRNMNVLPLEEALERLAERTLPPRACAITFDDGFLNNAEIAHPVLRELELPATIFLVTGMLGGDAALWPDRVYLALRATQPAEIDVRLRALKGMPAHEKDEALAALGANGAQDPAEFRLMTWEDVARLAEDPRIRFGAHTTSHEILSQLPDAEVEREIRESHAEVTRRLGYVPKVFAYPNGRPQDFDGRAQAALRALDVAWAVSTEEGLARSDGDPLAVRRICIGSDLPLRRFRVLVDGTVDWLKRR